MREKKRQFVRLTAKIPQYKGTLKLDQMEPINTPSLHTKKKNISLIFLISQKKPKKKKTRSISKNKKGVIK